MQRLYEQRTKGHISMSLFKDRYRVESARLKGWNYSAAGYYFVTLCTRERECWMGEITAGEVLLSPVGEIVRRFWREIPLHAPGIVLDEFVVMPNHLHGIVIIPDRKEAGRDVACNVSTKTQDGMSVISPKAGSLGAVIRSFKSAVTNFCRKIDHDFAWQPRFHDQVIRDEKSLGGIREYIRNNPQKWDLDENNPRNL